MAALAEGPFEAEVERITLRGEGGCPVEAIHARPDGMPTIGIVLHPDVMGIRPLFDDSGSPARDPWVRGVRS